MTATTPDRHITLYGEPARQMFGWLIPEGEPGHVPCPDEALIPGPTKSGKTHTVAEWIKYVCETYPDTRGLVVRKHKNSLTGAWQEVFERIIGPTHPYLHSGGSGARRQGYKAPGLGEIVLGGLDNPLKLYSTNYDWVYWNEVQEGTLEEWESLIRASAGRVSSCPVRVMIGDCNPAQKTHWANQRANAGVMHRIKGQLWDNPLMFDHDAMDWTPYGRKELSRFYRSYSGPRLERMIFGRWVTADGMVWPDYNPDVHVILAEPVKEDGLWYLDIASWGEPGKPERRAIKWFVGVQDVGYRNPGVAQVWGIDAEGIAYLIWEHYHTGWDHERWIEVWGEYSTRLGKALRYVTCDHDAAFIDTMNAKIAHYGKKGQPWFRPADKSAKGGAEKAGIDEVRVRLRVHYGQRCGMYFRSNSLEHAPDPSLEGKPTRTIDEIDGYVMAAPPRVLQNEKNAPEEPVKRDDHGCDGVRYLARALKTDEWVEKEPTPDYAPGTFGHVLKHNEVLRAPKRLKRERPERWRGRRR